MIRMNLRRAASRVADARIAPHSGYGLLPTTLSGLASSHVKALTLLGRSDEVLEATQRYIKLYERLKENENLPTLKVLQIEALVNLKKIDDAAAERIDVEDPTQYKQLLDSLRQSAVRVFDTSLSP